ncbi:MAG UNVERIFIED_CONTAM: PIN domain-containing protein [Planctomycetaceae bacterium]
MTTHFLIDLENVPLPQLPEQLPKDAQVWVFAGPQQTKVPLELVVKLQSLGERTRYIQLGSGGPNALDFHIAFHLGQLTTTEPDSAFVVVSGDTGFDPLIAQLRANNVDVKRLSGKPSKQVPAKPAPATSARPDAPGKPAAPAETGTAVEPDTSVTPAEQDTSAATSTAAEISQWELVERCVEVFSRMPGSRPKSLKRFKSSVRSFTRKNLPDEHVEELLRIFIQRKAVIQNGNSLVWGSVQKLSAALK